VISERNDYPRAVYDDRCLDKKILPKLIMGKNSVTLNANIYR